jgi:phage-related protein
LIVARGATDGEKPLDWVGSSKKDFLAFPNVVKDEMGAALGVAQFGEASVSEAMEGPGPRRL